MTMCSRSRLRRPWLTRFAWIAVSVPMVWVGGDFAYSRVVDHRLRRWEADVRREADGVRAGCAAFTLGDGETALLLIHGFGDAPPIFEKMAAALAERGFTCRAIRLPGFAEPMDAYAQTSREQWLAAVGEEVAALRRDHARVWLIGHSLGGTIAVRYALDQPEAVEGVALMAPLLGVSNSRSPILPARTWYELCNATLRFTTVVENPLPHDTRAPEVSRDGFSDRFIPAAVYRGMFDLIDDVNRRAGGVDRPLLMILAERDEVTDVDASKAFFRAARSPRKDLVCVGGSGHSLPVDPDWERAVDRIAEFAGGASDYD
ncbi:MAG: alpha/beta fold hydrolase [Kiritimatiellae bacterium]|nr:alpha/beta fold hydrolase [Kiritimatiellia bacterium]